MDGFTGQSLYSQQRLQNTDQSYLILIDQLLFQFLNSLTVLVDLIILKHKSDVLMFYRYEHEHQV